MARTACASAGPVAARRAGRERAATSASATPAAPSTGLVKMGSVNAQRAGMGSTAPLVGKRQAPKQAHIAFFS